MSKTKIKYLDPKNDLTFRKIFGERPHLVKSFLNSVLPLKEGQLIEEIEYLEPELIPELPNLKRSIVDVHCTDNEGRYFIVEMQMYWTSAFKKRMLFNTGKAYVRQLKGGQKYRDLKPVYGLSLVDDIFHKSEELKNTHYHHYSLVHREISDERIEGLELVFIELPKFKAQTHTDKRMQTLWLRFLTEIDENTKDLPSDLLENAEICEALECVEQSAFTEEELLKYDKYWDAIRVEKAALEELKERYALLNKEYTQLSQEKNQLSQEKNQLSNENTKLSKDKEEAIAREEKAKKQLNKAIIQMFRNGQADEQIAQLFSLSIEEVRTIIGQETP